MHKSSCTIINALALSLKSSTRNPRIMKTWQQDWDCEDVGVILRSPSWKPRGRPSIFIFVGDKAVFQTWLNTARLLK